MPSSHQPIVCTVKQLEDYTGRGRDSFGATGLEDDEEVEFLPVLGPNKTEQVDTFLPHVRGKKMIDKEFTLDEIPH